MQTRRASNLSKAGAKRIWYFIAFDCIYRFVALSPLSTSLSLSRSLSIFAAMMTDSLYVLCAGSPFDHQAHIRLRLPALSVPKLLQMRKFAQAGEDAHGGF